MNGDRLRAFVALMPDAASRDALHALPVTRGARRTLPAQLHVTLAFIGAIERERCDALAAHLPALAAAHALPPLPVERIAWWPSLPRARLIVAELAADPACVALNDGLSAVLRDRKSGVEGKRGKGRGGLGGRRNIKKKKSRDKRSSRNIKQKI
ncbi:2'-5' RNA ligase family protein [Burkholderia sp. Tr-20355]|uniref:2'-5' RNA ligase family protein n=1 Tax=Burkholderia sp. Tr-20355 TaxID=2703895 RepID=UPI001F11FA65|nr:2'-5' RNA ligase family protein [Burkholderia sp. Tr-20355]